MHVAARLPATFFTATTLIVGSVAAWLLAVGVTQLVGGAYLPLQAAALFLRTDVETPPPAPAPPKRVSAVTIVTRNPFDSSAQPEAAKPTTSMSTSSTSDEQPCATAYRLVVAAVDEENPARSLAVLADPSNAKPMVRIGSYVAGRPVVAIGGARVHLGGDAPACFIDGVARVAQPPQPPAIPAPTTALSTAPTTAAPIAGVLKIDETHFAVDRLLRDKLVDNPTDFMKTMRIAPEVVSGKTVGLRLLGVVPGSVFGVLGLAKGDVLESINGFEVASPEKMLEAYGRLKTAPALQVGITRGERKMVLEVEVR